MLKDAKGIRICAIMSKTNSLQGAGCLFKGRY
jgi:hypothetical protein